MICRILLFIILTSCVSGMFERHNMDLKYQAEEGDNVTVEWRFSNRTDISAPPFKMHCVSVFGLKVFYHLDNSVDESLHEQFAGRVQCDKDTLRTGRVRLHVSRVRTNDSGLYLCRMATGSGRKTEQFSLNITAPVDKPKPRTTEPAPVITKPAPVKTKPAPVITKPAPPGRERVGLHVALGLAAAAAALLYKVSAVLKLLLPSAGLKRNQPDGGGPTRFLCWSTLPGCNACK